MLQIYTDDFGVGEQQYDSFGMKLHWKMYFGNKPKVM